ncbi:MAG TPA: hypothetical protein GXX63_01985 [Tissierellia bacterium]|nr:hypothetical protein [Tissierellia bacterium]
MEEGITKKEKIARIISVLTVVPIVAFFTITLLYIKFKKEFISPLWYFHSILFLTILPISAYPLKYILPKYKNAGRDGERKLAFILAVSGYIIGSLLVLLLRGPLIVKKIFAAYVASGVLLAFVNKILKFKASGHACGVSGPITLLYHFLGKPILFLYLIMPLIFWSRINLKRHTYKELVAGTLVGIFSTLLGLWLL